MKFVIPSGITPYSIALLDMTIAKEKVSKGQEEVVFILEHEGVFSAGKSFETEDFISTLDYPVFLSNRGGRVTFHNPGQIVVYPIINLRARGITVSSYVSYLEDLIIKVLDKFGITGKRSEKGVGVWIKEAKIGFIGIRIEKGVAYHGLCLNVNNDLEPFKKIVPCGLKNIAITSLNRELGQFIHTEEVKKEFERLIYSLCIDTLC